MLNSAQLSLLIAIDPEDFKINVSFVPGTNIIGLVVLSTLIGIAMSILNTKVANFIALTNDLFELTMKVTVWAMSLYVTNQRLM